MIYEIRHVTRYVYDAPVSASFGEVYQLPADADGQLCLERRVSVTPSAEYYRERRDHFGNTAAVFTIREPHERLVVESTSVVDTGGRPELFGPLGERPWDDVVESGHGGDLSAAELALDSPLIIRSRPLADYATPSFAPGRPLRSAVLELNHRIHSDFAFDPKATDVETPLETVLELRRGVCQDFAHVLIGCLRSVGLAASYVSGYLETEPPPGKERLTGADRTHAWVGVHCGEGVWIGIDPTNDQLAGGRYVTTARGRDYGDVPPLKGVIFTDAEESKLHVAVDVIPTVGAS